MKRRIVFLIAGMALLTQMMPSHAEKKQPKIMYEFPEAMAPAVRAEFTKECDKGQALYNLACASCHNKILNGKTIVPDWTGSQLVGYELRVLNSNHETGIPEERVTAEELGFIMTFLRYRKRS